MIGTRLMSCIAIIAGLLLTASCGHFYSRESSLPASHPEALGEGRVECSECHTDQIRGIMKPYDSFSHSTLFVREHRFYAGRDDLLCTSCHARSFCNDCHANELEIKPSVKHGNRPDRELVHRGDYLTRHKIEGKVDPASCYRCHGRTNNEQCVACHK